MTEPRPLSEDARGILDPARLADATHFERFEPPPGLAGLIEWTWAVAWSLPAGLRHRQAVVTHPGVNFSVGEAPPEGPEPPAAPWPLSAEVYGVRRDLSTRVLSGTGWNVAAKTTVGGFGAFHAGPVSELTDRVRPLAELLDLPPDLAERIRAAGPAGAPHDQPDSQEERARLLTEALCDLVIEDRVETAREVAAIGRLAETDRDLTTLTDLAARAGLGPRTVQRLFAEYVGVSPTWVLRRYRLLDAAESVSDGARVEWAEVAARLGYADQAHLIRDFRATVGTTPEAYAAAQRT